ncbi:MAG: hypothetical protein ACYSUD_10635, partial [Planctomycetota bacterium]
WQDCAVKIPDWETCIKVLQSPSQRSCDKVEHCSGTKQLSLCSPLTEFQKKEKDVNRPKKHRNHPYLTIISS